MYHSKLFLTAGFVLTASLGGLLSTLFACGHKETIITVVQEATCENSGIEHHVCAKCDKIIHEEIKSPLGHDYSDYIIIFLPGPNQDGSQKRVCHRCYTEEITPVICPHNDTAVEVIIDPTCCDNGLERSICQDCGTVTEKDIPAIPHGDISSFITKKASCTPGVISNICNNCCSVVSYEEIPALEHKYGEWMLGSYATPLEEGYNYRICHICGNKDTKFYNIVMEDNVLYIPSLDLRCPFVVGEFTQSAVNDNDVLYTDWAYRCKDPFNPFVLGHNYGSMKVLHNIKIGEHIYIQLNGIIYDYVVMNSEYAVEYNGVSMIGQTTGVNVWDTYSSGLSSDLPNQMIGEGTDRRMNNTGMTLHMYTCYYGQNKPEWKPEHGRFGRWIVIADLVEKYSAINEEHE